MKIAESLLTAALYCHDKISSTFLPTATKFHYVFNLRDLSNIFQVRVILNWTISKFKHKNLHISILTESYTYYLKKSLSKYYLIEHVINEKISLVKLFQRKIVQIN